MPYRAVGADRGADTMLTIGTHALAARGKAADVAAVTLLLASGARTELPQIAGITPLIAAAGVGASSVDTRGTLQHRAADHRDPAAFARRGRQGR